MQSKPPVEGFQIYQNVASWSGFHIDKSLPRQARPYKRDFVVGRGVESAQSHECVKEYERGDKRIGLLLQCRARQTAGSIPCTKTLFGVNTTSKQPTVPDFQQILTLRRT